MLSTPDLPANPLNHLRMLKKEVLRPELSVFELEKLIQAEASPRNISTDWCLNRKR